MVGVAHGEVACFHRRLGDAGVFRSLAAGLEHQSAPFVLWAIEGGPGLAGLALVVGDTAFTEPLELNGRQHFGLMLGIA